MRDLGTTEIRYFAPRTGGFGTQFCYGCHGQAAINQVRAMFGDDVKILTLTVHPESAPQGRPTGSDGGTGRRW